MKNTKNTFFQKFGKSISSFEFYKNAKKTTVKSSIKYLAIMILIFSLISVGQLVYGMIGLYDLNVPEVTINNGIIETDVEQPYVLSDEDSSLYVIDSTGQYTNLDEFKRGVIIMNNKIIMKNNNYEIKEIDISNIESFTFNQKLINKIIFWAIILVSILVIIFLYIWLGIYTLIFSLIGLLIARIFKTKLKFEQTWIFAAYALTPVLVFGLILDLVGLSFPFRNSLIYLVYLIGIISKK